MPAETVIKLRRGTAAEWTSANPILAAGEVGLETDTYKTKYGDGATAWTSLSYSVATSSGGASVDWTDVLNKPVEFPPEDHTHVKADITDFAHTHVLADVTDVTATATELNYVDGVTSSVQTQIDGKVDETNGAVTTASTSLTVVRNITLSTLEPSGGSDGDIWLVYTA